MTLFLQTFNDIKLFLSDFKELFACIIPFFLFVLLVYLIWIRPANKKRKISKEENKCSAPGKITSVADVRKIEEQNDFDASIKNLHEKIQAEINTRQNNNDESLSDVNQFMISELTKLLKMDIKTKQDFEYVDWLFNDGLLRTEDEIKARQKFEYNTKYLNSGQYAEDCFINKTVYGTFGFFLPFTLSLLIFWKKLGFLSFIPATFIGLFLSIVGMVIATEQNITRAKEHDVPINHPRLQHDLNERNIAKAAGIISAISIGKHTKKAIKDVTNVDSWKEFK